MGLAPEHNAGVENEEDDELKDYAYETYDYDTEEDSDGEVILAGRHPDPNENEEGVKFVHYCTQFKEDMKSLRASVKKIETSLFSTEMLQWWEQRFFPSVGDVSMVDIVQDLLDPENPLLNAGDVCIHKTCQATITAMAQRIAHLCALNVPDEACTISTPSDAEGMNVINTAATVFLMIFTYAMPFLDEEQQAERHLPFFTMALRTFLASQPSWPWLHSDLSLVQRLHTPGHQHFPLRHMGPVDYLEWQEEQEEDEDM